MNINRFTQKAQEAVTQAQQIAQRNQQFEMQPLHLLQALTSQAEGVVPQILTRMGADLQQLRADVTQAINNLPKVSGAGGEPQLGRALREVLVGAHDEIQQFGDQYVSTEHLLLALLDHADPRTQELLKRHTITEDRILQALQSVRGATRVTSQNPEGTYDALGQYGQDLTEQARQGKLDPVIGRDEEIRRVIQILSRRTKNNPVLIGEPGVGKTA
ncbi:MAG: Clp protease N-terminal domain-containing protein, partial [Candidatus Binatia bacterium]